MLHDVADGGAAGVPIHLPDPHGRAIARFRLRIAGILAVRHALRLFFAWVMIWAAIVLGLRVVYRVESSRLVWGLAGLAVAAAVGAWLGARQAPSLAAIRAALDGHGGLGGLLMAAGDGDIGAWNTRIERVPMPALTWQFGRQWKLLAMGAAFLLAAFLMPDSYLPAASETALEIGSELQKLTEKMAVLRQEQVLPPDKAEVLEKELDRLREEASGKDPAKTMESLDHLEQSFSKAAAEAAESAVKETEKANQAQELAEALQSAMGEMDAKQLGDAMKELARMADQAAAENKSLADALSDELKEACKQGNLSESQLKELAEALKDCKAAQCKKIGKMIQAKLVDASALESCQQAGECNSKELADVLCQCKDGKEFADAMADIEGEGVPGRGGMSRGRGDAAMTWSQGAEKGDAAFKEQALPPSAAASLKDSHLAGVSVGDPTASEPAGGSSGGALGSAQAGGGEARSQVILPEHRKSVQRYFERERK